MSDWPEPFRLNDSYLRGAPDDDHYQQTDRPSQQMPRANPSYNRVQGDLRQDAALRRAWRHNMESPYNKVQGEAAENIPRVLYVERSQKIITANTPQLFLQMNLKRLSYRIGNSTGGIIKLSWGRSIGTGGVPINNNAMFIEQGAGCSINEIWITSPNANVFVDMFEGISAQVQFE